MNEASRALRWLRIVVPVAFICGMLMSRNLWFDFGRSFPRAPFLPGLNFPFDFVISILLLVALVISAVKAEARLYLDISVFLTVVLVSFDMARFQPWVYQYLIILGMLSFAHANESAAFAANQIVVATLYFWSGLQKLTWTFIYEVVPTLVESAGLYLSSRTLTFIAVTTAICELMIGVGLLIPRTRRVALVAACVMHAVILLAFVLTRRNSVIWPWNVAMIIITVILFARNKPVEYRTYYLPKLVMFLCGLMPALSFAGLWDLNLSGALYTGKTPVAVMRISESLRERLPDTAKQTTFTTSRGELMLPFYEWSLAALNVPPYPEVRVFREIARHVCALDSESALIIRGRRALTDGSYSVTVTTCADLLKEPHR